MRLALVVTALLALDGCALIFQGSTQTLTVRTSPPGASVFVKDEKRGETPLDVVIEKTGEPVELRFEQEGYVTESFFVKKTWNSLYTFEWLLIIPGIVDSFSVCRHKYAPSIVNVRLRPK
jgi:hypothetical protein